MCFFRWTNKKNIKSNTFSFKIEIIRVLAIAMAVVQLLQVYPVVCR